jgi:hypothetical protein
MSRRMRPHTEPHKGCRRWRRSGRWSSSWLSSSWWWSSFGRSIVRIRPSRNSLHVKQKRPSPQVPPPPAPFAQVKPQFTHGQPVVVVVEEVVVVVVVGHGPQSSVPPQPSEIIPQSAAPHVFGVQTHCPVTSHVSGGVQVPHEPPHPSSPQVLFVQFGTHEHWPPTIPSPVGQQRPNRAFAFLAMGFAQFRLQQLTFVAHCWPLGLQRQESSPSRQATKQLRVGHGRCTSAGGRWRTSGPEVNGGGVQSL